MSAVAARVEQLEDFRLWAREIRNDRIEAATERPRIRLWDGDWKFRGTLASEISGQVSLNLNQPGTITLTLPIDLDDERGTFLAFWILKEEERKQNVHVTIDKNGARVGGRMRKATLKQDPAGDTVVVEFDDDIAELQYVHVAGNPFLPLSIIQLPKAWFLWTQAKYGLKLTLALNLFRLNVTNFNLGSDPLDPAGWGGGLWADAQIVVKPGKLGDDISPPTIITSRMGSFLDVAAPILEDAELMLDCRRYLTGDPAPWPGAPALRNGTLVVDIVDKSGYRQGTSMGGNLLTGLTRAIAGVTSSYVEDSYDMFTGDPIDNSGYRLPGFLGTQPENPYVVYRDSDVTGIQSVEFTRMAGGPCRITAGGQSMPGVNELIKSAVNYAGDVIGDNLVIAGYGVGSLGSAINAFLEPIYRDSILAYMSVPLILRSAKQGWGHYLETTATGSTQAYTPAAIMDLRKRRRETDPDTAFTFTVMDAQPWSIGDRGEGHWWLGDRVGGTSKYLMPRVFVSRCRSLELSWDRSSPPVWQAKFGDPRAHMDPIDRLVYLVSQTMSGLTENGLWG